MLVKVTPVLFSEKTFNGSKIMKFSHTFLSEILKFVYFKLWIIDMSSKTDPFNFFSTKSVWKPGQPLWLIKTYHNGFTVDTIYVYYLEYWIMLQYYFIKYWHLKIFLVQHFVVIEEHSEMERWLFWERITVSFLNKFHVYTLKVLY